MLLKFSISQILLLYYANNNKVAKGIKLIIVEKIWEQWKVNIKHNNFWILFVPYSVILTLAIFNVSDILYR